MDGDSIIMPGAAGAAVMALGNCMVAGCDWK